MPSSACRLVEWLVMVVVVSSCFLSVWLLIVVESEPNLSSSLSSNSFMTLVRYRSVMSGLRLVAFPIACILSAMASRAGACASRIAILLGSDPSMLPRCGMKSIRRPRMMVDLWIHSV